MSATPEVPARVLARSTAINFVGLLTPLVVGVVTIPFIIEGLGKERFGILALAWAFTIYLSLLDLGLSRASTKFVSEAMARNELDRIGGIVRTAATTQVFFGTLVALAVAGLSPLLVGVLDISPAVTEEARSVFLRLALAIPFLAMSSSFIGTLEASQRYGMLNAVRVPMSLGNFLIPALGVQLGWSLPTIVLALPISQILGSAAYLTLAMRLFPSIRTGGFDRATLRRLFSYGGWVTVTGLLGPVLQFLERFALGILAPVRLLAYYAAPYEMITRLWLFPTALVSPLFPALSILSERGEDRALTALVARAAKYLMLVLGPLVLLFALNAFEVLNLWLGRDFADASSVVLQLLCLGVFFNSLSWIAFTTLQAVGRADVPAKIAGAQLPVHIVIVVTFVSLWGVTGAAVAWATRSILDVVLMFAAMHRLHVIPFAALSSRKVPLLGALLVACLALGIAGTTLIDPLWGDAFVTLGVVGGFVLLAWRAAMTTEERHQLVTLVAQGWRSVVGRRRPVIPPPDARADPERSR